MTDRCRRTPAPGRFAVLTSLMLGTAAPAAAQSTGGVAVSAAAVIGPADADAIIVTAQRRKEALKDVPISITALGAVKLEALRVTKVTDFITTVPNATSINAGAFYGPSISFRGISNFSAGNYDVISVTIDDVGYGATTTTPILSSELNDIDRVEVLRGPQGTLTGRNALGGSINIITNKPDPSHFGGSATVDYGRFDTLYSKLVLNVPLSSVVAIRTTGFYERSDGAIRNINPVGGTSGYHNLGGRVALRLMPTERLTIDATFGYERLRRGMENLLTYDFATPDLKQQFTDELANWGGGYPGPIDYFRDRGNNGGTVDKDTKEYTHIRDWLASFRGSYKLDPFTVDLIYGHFDYQVNYKEDYDQTEYAWWNTDQSRKVKSDSFELRFTSAGKGPLNWVSGVSYLQERYDFTDYDNVGAWYLDGDTPHLNGVGGYTPGYVGHDQNDIRSFGVFGNLFWDIRSGLHLSAGVRYSIERNRLGSFFVYDPDEPDAVTMRPFLPEEYQRARISRWSPRVALTYDLNRRSSVYAQFSTGYRAGYGNTSRVISFGAPRQVSPESLRNYEIGFKGQVIPRLLSINAAAYYMQYTNLQVQAPIPPSLFPDFQLFYDLNAGKAHSRGFELEATLTPATALTFTGAVGYTDAVIDRISYTDPDTLETTELRNIAMPKVRPWTAAASAEWTPRLTDGLTGLARIQFTYQDALYYQGITPDLNWYVPAYHTFDLTLGVTTPKYRVTAYFDNILNEKYFTSIGWFDVGRRGRMVYTPPRSFGVRVVANLDSIFGH